MSSFRWLLVFASFLFFDASDRAVAQPLGSESERRRFGCSQSELDKPFCGRLRYSQPKRHQSICRRVSDPSADLHPC